MATERREFTQEEINVAWEKAKIVSPDYSNEWRKDYAGAWIKRDRYGKQGDYGWEIDHLKPLDLDGTYDEENLVPLHWQNNRTKFNNYPQWKTSISSDGNKNIELEQEWYV